MIKINLEKLTGVSGLAATFCDVHETGISFSKPQVLCNAFLALFGGWIFYNKNGN